LFHTSRFIWLLIGCAIIGASRGRSRGRTAAIAALMIFDERVPFWAVIKQLGHLAFSRQIRIVIVTAKPADCIQENH
jgi:hypothetical protein